MVAPQHVEGGRHGGVDVGALQGDAVGPGEGLHAGGRPLDALQRLGHHLHVLGQVGIVLDPLAQAPQAVLHAVQRVGDLVGDPRHQLADAQHLLLLADLGVGAVHVAADRGGEIDGDPQGAVEGHEDAQQVQPVQRRRRSADRRENAWETAESNRRCSSSITVAHHRRYQGSEEIRRRAAEVHPGDDHVEEEVDEEGVAGEVGEIQQQRQGHQVEDDLEEDLAVDVPLAGASCRRRRNSRL